MDDKFKKMSEKLKASPEQVWCEVSERLANRGFQILPSEIRIDWEKAKALFNEHLPLQSVLNDTPISHDTLLPIFEEAFVASCKEAFTATSSSDLLISSSKKHMRKLDLSPGTCGQHAGPHRFGIRLSKLLPKETRNGVYMPSFADLYEEYFEGLSDCKTESELKRLRFMLTVHSTYLFTDCWRVLLLDRAKKCIVSIISLRS